MYELYKKGRQHLRRPLHLSSASSRSACPQYPSCSPVFLRAFKADVSSQHGPSTTYPVDLAVSRETCSALRWYSVDTVRIPLYRLLRHPHAPMRRRCVHNLSEGVEQPAARRCAEHRHPTHTIRCTTDFCSSRRNVRGTLASYSSPGRGPAPPRGRGQSIPFPQATMNPGRIDVTSTDRIRTSTALQRLAAGFT